MKSNKLFYLLIILFLLLNLLFLIIYFYFKTENLQYIGFFIYLISQILEPFALISIFILTLKRTYNFILFFPTFLNIIFDYFLKRTLISSDYIDENIIIANVIFQYPIYNLFFVLILVQILLLFIFFIFLKFRNETK
ncbi:hypothetical protein CSF_1009 [Campylobacter sputorum bv. faecalis CCUG 20703]|nr:hypothetical protein CSF_1009 [Campylobacter sputorum bv. faecalis CCUG 20703]